jgi:hypothetical protein
MRRTTGRATALAALAALALATGVAAAAPAAASGAPAASVSAAPAVGHRLLLKRSPGATAPSADLRAFTVAGTAALPASVDLSRNAVAVADQGAVGSCAAWAIGYGMLGWLARSQGHAGAPYAPMYVYSQVDGGGDQGSTPVDVLEVLRTQGIDTAAHYGQRHARAAFDWAHLPSAAERTAAAANKISGWVSLYNTVGAAGAPAATALKQTLASGRPVALTIGVYQRFLDAAGPHGLVTSTGNLGRLLGYHELLAVGYDSRGVRVQNSWGTSWGERGYAILDWGYVTAHSYEAETVAGFAKTSGTARPVVTAVSATTGSRRGGQTLSVSGSRLTGAVLSVGPRSAAASSVTADGRKATFRVPAGAPGVAALRLSTPAGIAVTGAQTYRYS